ncbi:hypothetical protein B0H14DRAFT_2440227 [Mycena olivaceomarginata]|nr:hypothetical protein B0H14DRAFT_2440227 [Mycena olivaceomarginata]
MSGAIRDQDDCTRICPGCIGAEILELKLPESPCPELLLNNAAPSDFGVLEIKNVIEGVEQDIRGIDIQIAQLQRLTAQLLARRGELHDFAHDHRGTISSVRRVPSDIIAEIFLRCVDPDLLGGYRSSSDALEPIMQVCGQWRAVALGSPRLWNRFVIDEHGIGTEDRKLIHETSLQLQRSGQAPLSLSLGNYRHSCPPRILDILLDVSPRWHDVRLSLSEEHYRFLFATTCPFPVLKKLSIYSGESVEWPAEVIRQFFDRLPRLEELRLENEHPFSDLSLLPWSRLRIRALKRCKAAELLRVLSLLSPETRVFTQFGGSDADLYPVAKVQSPICALELHLCETMFMGTILDHLTASSLEELVLSHPRAGSNLAPTILAFLNRSKCTLTHLSLRTPLDAEGLLSILESPYARGILHLDIRNGDIDAVERCIDVLASGRILPNLRVLEFHSNVNLEETAVMTMVASRRPVLQELRIGGWPHCPLLSLEAVQALGADGLELMLSG